MPEENKEPTGKQDDPFVWKYKDSHRYWWRITCWDTEETRENGLEDCTKDSVWYFAVERESGGEWREVYRDNFVGQYDLAPSLEELVGSFLTYIGNVAIGFNKHGDLRPEDKETDAQQES